MKWHWNQICLWFLHERSNILRSCFEICVICADYNNDAFSFLMLFSHSHLDAFMHQVAFSFCIRNFPFYSKRTIFSCMSFKILYSSPYCIIMAFLFDETRKVPHCCLFMLPLFVMCLTFSSFFVTTIAWEFFCHILSFLSYHCQRVFFNHSLYLFFFFFILSWSPSHRIWSSSLCSP